jgi:predicted nucleic acid-binding protein
VAFVLDASVKLAWCFEDETTSYTEGVLDLLRTTAAIVPVIWPFEVANALLVGERRRRLRVGQSSSAVERPLDLPIGLDDMTISSAWVPVLVLARQHDLAAYDAAYLELAQRLVLAIATIDNRQRDVATQLGIPLVRIAS